MMKDALQTIAAEVLEDFDLAREAARDGTYVLYVRSTVPYIRTYSTYESLNFFDDLIFRNFDISSFFGFFG